MTPKYFLSALCALLLVCSPTKGITAVVFDEVDDYLQQTDAAALTFPDGDWSIGTLLEFDDTGGTAFKYYFSNNNYAATNSVNCHLGEVNEDTLCQINDGDTDGIEVSGCGPMIYDTPIWLFLIRDGSAGFVYYYGIFPGDSSPTQCDSAAIGTFGSINGGTVYLGKRADSNSARFFGGTIYEHFRMNGYALSEADMTAIANSRLRYMAMQIGGSNMLYYFTFDEQPDGTSADGDTFFNKVSGSLNFTGNDGANNSGLTNLSESSQTYP